MFQTILTYLGTREPTHVIFGTIYLLLALFVLVNLRRRKRPKKRKWDEPTMVHIAPTFDPSKPLCEYKVTEPEPFHQGAWPTFDGKPLAPEILPRGSGSIRHT